MMWLRQPCKEMSSYNLILDGVPERIHPKSFRSTFEVNTNVWASREPRFIPYLEVGETSRWQVASKCLEGSVSRVCDV
jgi:hypothetical protein